MIARALEPPPASANAEGGLRDPARRRRITSALLLGMAGLSLIFASAHASTDCPDLEATADGPIFRDARPTALVEGLPPGAFRTRLESCLTEPPRAGPRTIGHRGAPLRYPEHTRQSYLAAARLGATTLECDVTFTRDQELVCRHDACDLHRTTNVLRTKLAESCSESFQPALIEDGILTRLASARCCVSDFSREEFLSLEGRHDRINPTAGTVDDYLEAKAEEPTCLEHGTLVTHRESISLFQSLGVGMAPELKAPGVELPAHGKRLEDYADELVQAYRDAGVPPGAVWLQSFDPDIVRHWLATAGEFAERVVWLDGRYALAGFDHRDSERLATDFQAMVRLGLKQVAPPLWMLVEAGADGIIPSRYGPLARAAGLELITWTLERSGDLAKGGGWYYQTLNGSNPLPGTSGGFRITRDADQLLLARVLFEDIGVRAVFSDWPSTTALVDRCLSSED